MTQYGCRVNLKAEHDSVVGGYVAESDLESCVK